MSARLQTNVTTSALKPTLRDRARNCRVEWLFGNYFRVTNLENGHAYRVEAEWLDGDVAAFCQCFKAKAGTCHHELAVQMFERTRVTSRQFEN